jgi:hypothetical protein
LTRGSRFGQARLLLVALDNDMACITYFPRGAGSSQNATSQRAPAPSQIRKGQRTARLRFAAGLRRFGLSSVTDALAERDHPWAAGMRRVENVVRAAVSADRVAGLRGPEGRIDFEHERALYSQVDSDWKLFARDSRYIGKPGEWYADNPDGLYGNDPFWLLAILEGTVEATARGDETVDGETCHLYTGTADFKLAERNSTRQLKPPLSGSVDPDEGDSFSLPIEVWLDDDGRIRRAVIHWLGNSVTQMDLSGFAEPDPIALPVPSEIAPE